MNTQNRSFGGKLFRPFAWSGRQVSRFWRWYKSLYRQAPWWKKAGIGAASFVAFLVFYCFAVQINLFWLFGKSPSLSSIMHPKNAAASEIYSDDGKLLGKFFNENRSPVPYDSIAPAFVDALISTEDERFYSHHGVDFFGIFAAMKDAAQGHARGASTITQQLVKNMFRVRTEYSTGLLGYIPGVKILIMKSKEMIIATELELFCSKQEILTMYANTVDFGSNAYGIKTAAKTYFKTTPAALKTEEAAVLVGLLKATSAYNPKLHPKNSLRRRNTVLDNMRNHGKLSAEECERLKEKPIELKFGVESAYDGQALYFRQAVAEEMKTLTPELDPYRDGLKIYTTLNSRMQQYAEEAMRQQMRVVQRNFDSHWGRQDPWVGEGNKPLPNFVQEKMRQTDAYKMLSARYPDDPAQVWRVLNTPHKVRLFTYDGPIEREMTSIDSLHYMLHYMHAGFVAIEPQNGYVRAYVGDVDFNTWQHDNVSAAHQPGSTFKLFAYATAIKQGWLPSDARLKDEYIQMDVVDKDGKPSVWRPHNANGRFSGANIPLRAAFAQSINTIAIKLGQEVGIDNVIRTAQDMGVQSRLENAPSLVLGASDATVMEMVGAYAAVANSGEYVKPTLITKIVDADGKVVYESRREAHTVMTAEEAFYMQTLLAAGVTDAGGTSQSLGAQQYAGKWFWNRTLDMGGKTGTSNSHADAWFIGVTPNLVGGAWVGGEYRQIHFRTGALGQGSKTALPIFGLFLNKVLSDAALRDHYLAKFNIPDGVNPADLEGRMPALPTDTLSADSTLIDNDDLMDAPDAPTPENGEAPAPPAEPAPAPAAPTAAPVPAPAAPSAPAEKSEKKSKAKPSKPARNKDDMFN